MSDGPSTFVAVSDGYLADIIGLASRRIIYVAPGVGTATANALVRHMTRTDDDISLTIILDADADAYRIGYGDPGALSVLHGAASQARCQIRRQRGVRVGLLVADDNTIIWSPTPQAVETEREVTEPNGVVLSGTVATTVDAAVGANSVNMEWAEIGRESLQDADIAAIIKDLERNPPAPFDLTRRARVFSTRFQFVEFEVRGAEWTERRIKLSSLFLNADLPEALQGIIDTQVRPFQSQADTSFDVPLVIRGQRAFHEDGRRIVVPATQSDILKSWNDIRARYLRQVKGFGWLVRRDQLEQFQSDVGVFEETLAAWVGKFRERMRADEDKVVKSIVEAIRSRLEHARLARLKESPTDNELSKMVQGGLDRLRVIEPKVKVVVKDISWHGSRDAEFLEALQRAIPSDELKGWSEEFTVALEAAESKP